MRAFLSFLDFTRIGLQIQQKSKACHIIKTDIDALASSAQSRLHLLKTNLPGYLVSPMLAGMFVGFGVICLNAVGVYFQGNPALKLLQGVVFTAALSLVVIAGAELFTGNNLTMSIGFLEKKFKLKDLLLAWLVCFFGNWIGGIGFVALPYWLISREKDPKIKRV